MVFQNKIKSPLISILLALFSYCALLILIMPPSLSGMIQTAVLFVIGAGAILFCRLRRINATPDTVSHALALIQAVYCGLQFYKQWILSSKIQAVAAALHLAPSLPVFLGSVLLSLCAVWITAQMIQQVRTGLSTFRCKHPFAGNLAVYIICSVICVCFAQTMIDLSWLSMGWLNFLWGTATVFAFLLLLYGLFGNLRLSLLLGTGLILAICTVNAYVFLFRSRLFEPVDIFSAGTALNVAGNYSIFPIPSGISSRWGIWAGLMTLICLTGTKKKKVCSFRKRSLLAGICAAALILSALGTQSLTTYHWTNEGALFNGYLLDFISRFSEAFVSKPEGYNPEEIQTLSESYRQSTDTAPAQQKTPHIIAIMNESFSDLNMVAELHTDTEVMPFVSSLKQDAIRGYALASVYGGNTANSEYEFLTGNSMAWLSPNAVPFNQYIRSPQYSIVSHLKTNYGYNCIAMHPYMSSGWNRPSVYAHLGFDESLFEEDFPQEQYVRNYVSDREMYETIVSLYENKGDSPLFLYGVTVQNHGGYSYTGDNYTPGVSLLGYSSKYPDAEQYLTLIRESDKAVEYLISYFDQVEEDVVIVFFGDHQPKLSEAFWEEAGKTADDTLQSRQRRYIVPFFVWANYDIEEKYIDCTSLNYLTSYVYEAAGMPLPPYNQFLAQFQSHIPIINANGFYSLASGEYLPFDMASPEEALWLQRYEKLQYNALIDNKHRNHVFFPICN